MDSASPARMKRYARPPAARGCPGAIGREPLRRILAWILAAGLCLASSGCFLSKIRRPFGGNVAFDVQMDPRMNEDFPLAVDFVIVYDKDLYKEIMGLNAGEWFSKRDQYRAADAPDKLEISSWQWVPDQGCTECAAPKLQVVDYRKGAKGGIIFSNYFNSGTHRLIVDPLEHFTLELGETSAKLQSAQNNQSKKPAKKRKWWLLFLK